MSVRVLQGLRQLPRALLAFSEAFSDDAHCGKGIVMRFVDALMNLHPRLRLAILLSTPWVSLACALTQYQLIMSGLTSVKRYFFSCITGSVVIPTAHPLSKPVMAYMVKQGLGKGARNLALQTPQVKPKMSSHDRYMYDIGLSRGNKPTKQEEEDREPDTLELIPDVGSFTFFYNGKRLMFEKRAASNENALSDQSVVRLGRYENDETIVLSCINVLGSTKPITDFLQHIKESTDKATESMTKIFRPENLSGQIAWDQGVARPARTLEAVTLDAHVKDPLVTDIQNYLNEETKKFYISRNIPWRRGYLFYGPPGTGKTSMACAIAGQYGLNVYLLSMTQTGINDETLVNLFEALPNKCILLLEDIDSAGIKREDMKKPKPVKKASAKRGHHRSYPYGGAMLYDEDGNPVDPMSKKDKVTLSTLLNVLDGISAPEGRIVIMTSNNPDSLDKALVRPGRIDRKVLFDHASHEVSHKLFLRVFGESGTDNVSSMAQAFAGQIPENVITPAEVQGHLLQNMASAEEALQNTGKFVEDILAEKRGGTNVAGFKAEVAESGAQQSDQKNVNTSCSASNETDEGTNDEPNSRLETVPEPAMLQGFPRVPATLPQQMLAASPLSPSSFSASLAGAAPSASECKRKKKKKNGSDQRVLAPPSTATTSRPMAISSSMPTSTPIDSASTNALPSIPVTAFPLAGPTGNVLSEQANSERFMAALGSMAPSTAISATAGVKLQIEEPSDETDSAEEDRSGTSTPLSSVDDETSSVVDDDEEEGEEDTSESEADEEDESPEEKMVDSAYESN